MGEFKRVPPVELYDSRLGESYLVIFDEVSEEKAANLMVKMLREGVPESRKVRKIPDFLKEAKLE